eukprot:1782408-Amphidinium_carterae.1
MCIRDRSFAGRSGAGQMGKCAMPQEIPEGRCNQEGHAGTDGIPAQTVQCCRNNCSRLVGASPCDQAVVKRNQRSRWKISAAELKLTVGERNQRSRWKISAAELKMA